MSNSAQPSADGERVANGSRPRAIVHKQILAAADSDPDASASQLASRVSGASLSLVERVLTEYSPSDSTDHRETADGSPSATKERSSTDPAIDGVPDVDEVTIKQRRTLREIHRRPDATQSDLAASFDVDRSSISHRLNNVAGFQWDRRHQFVRRFFDERRRGPDDGRPGSRPQSSDAGGSADDEGVCGESGAQYRSHGESSETLDAALVHKIIRLCVESDDVTEPEERAVVDYLMNCSKE